jgi:hypothetical protein
MGEGVAGAEAKVAVQGDGGLAAEGDGALAATLAEDDHDLVVQVQVVGQQDAGGLGDANTPVSMNRRMIALSRRSVKSRPSQECSRRRSWLSVRTGGGWSGAGAASCRPSGWSSVRLRPRTT